MHYGRFGFWYPTDRLDGAGLGESGARGGGARLLAFLVSRIDGLREPRAGGAPAGAVLADRRSAAPSPISTPAIPSRRATGGARSRTFPGSASCSASASATRRWSRVCAATAMPAPWRPCAATWTALPPTGRRSTTRPGPWSSPRSGRACWSLPAERCRGAIPYNVTPEHTGRARAILGPGRWLAVEQKVCLSENAGAARAAARKELARYMTLDNYRNNWLRTGFSADDMESGGSDRLMDAMVAWGSAEDGRRAAPGAFRRRRGPGLHPAYSRGGTARLAGAGKRCWPRPAGRSRRGASSAPPGTRLPDSHISARWRGVAGPQPPPRPPSLPHAHIPPACIRRLPALLAGLLPPTACPRESGGRPREGGDPALTDAARQDRPEMAPRLPNAPPSPRTRSGVHP